MNIKYIYDLPDKRFIITEMEAYHHGIVYSDFDTVDDALAVIKLSNSDIIDLYDRVEGKYVNWGVMINESTP